MSWKKPCPHSFYELESPSGARTGRLVSTALLRTTSVLFSIVSELVFTDVSAFK